MDARGPFDDREAPDEPGAREARYIRQREALLSLTLAAAPRGDDPLPALRQITEAAARALDVARVSIWRYDAARTAIRCIDLYERAGDRHRAGAELAAAGHPAYFAALSRTEVIAADDAHRDPRTCEFSADYLMPLGISSMLDAPVHLRGVADGVLCHEHVGPPRRWLGNEKTFALAMANLVSLALESADRAAAEQALRRSERHLRAIFGGTSDYFGLLGVDGTLLEANRALIDFAPELMRGAVGRKFWDIAWFRFTPGLAKRVRDAVAAAAAGRAVRERIDVVHPWREPMVFDFSLHPVRDERGAVVLIVPEGRDITERVRAQAREHELELELLQAQKMESLGTLAGGIAHDFNNILGAILGHARLACDELADGHPARARLEQIGCAGVRARGLVRQILTFSRRDPQQELQVQPLQPLIAETLALLRATLPPTVRLDSRLAEAPLPVRFNATLLQQVLLNLGTNAWHALPEAGGRIEVGLRLDEVGAAPPLPAMAPGRYAHLWVTDSGCGMDPATLARVFEPFFTTKPVGRGTGLGLSVAHGIVSAHGGVIGVRSAPGEGTTVDLYLPLVEEAAAVLPDARRHTAAGGRGQHVVYIDDDPVMGPVAEGLLRRAGYRVSAYGDPRDALRALRADPAAADVVVTDYNMPELSGLQVAGELAALRPTLPVVITSGFIDEELHRRAAEVNVRHLLRKEHACDELCALVGRVLADAR